MLAHLIATSQSSCAAMISDERLKELSHCLGCVVRVKRRQSQQTFEGTLCKVERVIVTTSGVVRAWLHAPGPGESKPCAVMETRP